MSSSTLPSTLRVALIGNPNTGKSTLFSALAGIHQRVANYPGVTVEKKTGRMEHAGRHYELIDLPGLYSLAPRSRDEMVAVDVLLGHGDEQSPVDAVVCIVDASNLERNLYLASQVLELGLPTVVALNMIDVAGEHGITLDVDRLQRQLGVPVVPIQAHRRVGLAPLKAALDTAICGGPRVPESPLPEPLRLEAARLEPLLARRLGARGEDGLLARMLAQRLLLDGNGYLQKALLPDDEEISGELAAARERLDAAGCRVPDVEASARYDWARRMLAGAVVRPDSYRATISDRIDRVLTHRLWGTLVLVAVMVIVFQAVFVGARPLTGLIDRGADALERWLATAMPEGALRSLLADGVLRGAGSVLAFLPQIGILFLFIAVLEDCGYMARAACLMDKLMSRVGLSGKSFLPMLSSFACAVPGIMGARVVENERDRITTILVAPLMTCSARLPVYWLLAYAFIPPRTYLGGLLSLPGLAIVGMYALGVVTAMGMAWLLKRTMLRGGAPLFLLELPSYKVPSLRTAVFRVLERMLVFLRCAGTLILAVSVLTWAAMYYPAGPKAPQQSLLARVGRLMEPAVRPLGWDWRIGCAVVASFPAREVVVATMGVIFQPADAAAAPDHQAAAVEADETQLQTALKSATWEHSTQPLFSVPVALSIMVFYALCAQCVATLAVIRRETNSWRWPAFTFAYMTALAYVGALLTYQAGTWIGALL